MMLLRNAAALGKAPGHWWTGWVPSEALVVLACGGVLKLLDLSSFVSTLEGWTIVPRSSKTLVGVIVPIAEVMPFLMHLPDRRSPWPFRLAAFLLAGIGVAVAAQWTWGAPPSCGCLGALGKYLTVHSSLKLHVLVLGVLLAIVMTRIAEPSSTARSANNKQRSIAASLGARGMTLVETLVAIAIVALLTILLIGPVLSIRSEARNAVSLSNIRQHNAVFHSYSSDYKDAFPMFGDPGATSTVFWHDNTPTVAGYFGLSYLWPLALSPGYYPSPLEGSFRSPHEKRGLLTSYVYSGAMYSRPEYWRQETRSGPSQFGVVHLHEVVFPVNKGLFIDDTQWFQQLSGSQHRRATAGFQDGGASMLAEADAIDPYPNAFGAANPAIGYSAFPIVVNHSVDGVRGRDVRQRR